MARANADVRPPRTEDCLRQSIEFWGVIHPVLMDSEGNIIDGKLRAKIATEMGVTYKVEVQDSRAPAKARRTMNQNVMRMRDENYKSMSMQIVGLAAQRGPDNVGLWPEEVIAAALGVSTEHVVQIMARHLEPGHEDARELFPAKRRRVDGTIGDATVTTVDVIPIPRPPPTMPPHHEVLSYIPENDPVAVGQLRASLEKNGQTKPILLSRNGLLVDGRARWRILTEMGVTPEVTTAQGNPWEAALAANVDRFPNVWDRLSIVAAMPPRTSPTMTDDQRQPTVERAAHGFRLSTYSVRSFRMIVSNGSPALVKAVTDEVIKVGTAIRMIREVPTDQWDTQIEEMRESYARGTDVALPMDGVGVSHNHGRTAGRSSRGGVTAETVNTAIIALEALGLVLDGADGLDPRITREQAAELSSRLSTARRPLGQLNTMLKHRKETT